VLKTASGDISLSGQNLTFGTNSLLTQIISSGAINLTVGASGGTLIVNDLYSEMKAGSNIVISSGAAAASATGQFFIAGQVQAVGSITITANHSINLTNADVVAMGNITISSTGDISLSAGMIESEKGVVTLTADSDKNGSGALLIAPLSPFLISGAGNVVLSGQSIAIGSAIAFARVIASANLSLFADDFSAGDGGLTITNSATQIQVGGSLQIGATTPGSLSPYDVSITGGTLTVKGAFSLSAVDSVSISSTTFTISSGFTMEADNAITLSSGTLITAGGALLLQADFNAAAQAALTLQSGVTIADSTATVTLMGFTISNSAAITSSKTVSTPGS